MGQQANLPQLDTSGVHLWLVLWKASRSLEQVAYRSIQELGLGLSDFGVLEALLHKGSLPIGEIGGKVLLTSGSMTAAVDRLERKGLVERASAKGDRRVREIRLTPAGKGLIRKAFAEHAKAMEEAVAGLETQQRICLIDLLRQVGQMAGEMRGK